MLDVESGDPTLLVLSSLADGDKHGNSIMQDASSSPAFAWGPGTLYGAITRLEERGWIRAVDSDDRRKALHDYGAGPSPVGRRLERSAQSG
jgi:DNA-binding PadR family transcriptional regulator